MMDSVDAAQRFKVKFCERARFWSAAYAALLVAYGGRAMQRSADSGHCLTWLRNVHQ